MTAGILVDQILQRVRDPQGVTTSRDFVRARLSDSQRLLNARFGWVLDETTLVTEPLRIFYPVPALLPEATRVWHVRQATRDLVRVSWKTFWSMEQGWPRAVGPRYELWSPIGRDLVVVWPASRVSVSLTVVSSRLIPSLHDDASAFEVSDDVMPMVSDLATVLVLLKQRDFAPIAEVMSTLMGRIKERSLAP